VDGDLPCSGLNLAVRARQGRAGRGERSTAFEPGEGMGKNRGRARCALREEERGVPNGWHGTDAVEVGAGQATCKQGRRGWRGPGRVAVMGLLAWADLNEQ
jgi:hypothetical protein